MLIICMIDMYAKDIIHKAICKQLGRIYLGQTYLLNDLPERRRRTRCFTCSLSYKQSVEIAEEEAINNVLVNTTNTMKQEKD
jgi:hypothetical protein